MQEDQHPMLKYRGSLVRTKRGMWDPFYRNQVFLVVDVVLDIDKRWTYRLYDRIGGGFIWASPSEVSRVRTGEKKSTGNRRPREDREYAKVLGRYGPARKVRHRD